MKVFLSWSGEVSHKVALAFRDWLPLVIQSIEPYVSSEDIEKGTRWGAEMAAELEKSRFGIICVTAENVNKPWINFEAGALSRSIETATVRPFSSAVSPFLFDIKSSDLEGPLTQFQYVVNEKSDMLKLLSSINGRLDVQQLGSSKLEKAFERWWPDLETVLTDVANEGPIDEASTTKARKPEEILDELLELVRTQQRLMISKDDLPTLITEFGNSIRAAMEQRVRSTNFGAAGFGTALVGTGFTRGVSRVENIPNAPGSKNAVTAPPGRPDLSVRTLKIAPVEDGSAQATATGTMPEKKKPRRTKRARR